MTKRKPYRIAVVGGGQCSAQAASLAREVGAELARKGCVLITGGLSGVMEAASWGAKSAGGVTVGILPGHSADEANQHVDIPIVTGLSQARNVLVVRSADVVIAIDGQHGTLSEIALGLNMGIPVVGLKTWEIPGVITARTALEAVEEALKLAEKNR